MDFHDVLIIKLSGISIMCEFLSKSETLMIPGYTEVDSPSYCIDTKASLPSQDVTDTC